MSSKEIGAKAAAQAAPAEEVKFAERLNDFMHANRNLFLIIGVAVIALVAGLGIYSVVSTNLLAKSTVALETLEEQYAGWADVAEADKAAKGAELVAGADGIISRYGKRYAALRAFVVKAEILASINDAAGAEKAYAAAADSFPKSHIAPVALANAAALAEDRGDTDAALAYLQKASTDYPAAPGAGRTLLSIGRIYESTRQYDKAMEMYARLLASGAETDWTKIAHDRIILLKAQGLVK